MLVYVSKHHRISLVLAVIGNIGNIISTIDLHARKITLDDVYETRKYRVFSTYSNNDATLVVECTEMKKNSIDTF
jgi:hypothetical protein